MKKNYFILGILFLWALNAQAQFYDDMETYTEGEAINAAHWTNGGCGEGIGCDLIASSEYARSGVLSGKVPGDGTTNSILDLGNKIFGEWGLSLWLYIPSGKEAVMSFQGGVPTNGDASVVGDIVFNENLNDPGIGKITDSALGEVQFNFPHDQWFRVVVWWDINTGIDMATWVMFVYDTVIIPQGTLFSNENGDMPNSIGGVQFYSNSLDNQLFVDDVIYQDEIIINSTEDFYFLQIKLYPNPSSEIITVSTTETINKISIYNLIGNKVFETTTSEAIHISALPTGMYFVIVETDNGKGVQKFIKN